MPLHGPVTGCRHAWDDVAFSSLEQFLREIQHVNEGLSPEGKSGTGHSVLYTRRILVSMLSKPWMPAARRNALAVSVW